MLTHQLHNFGLLLKTLISHAVLHVRSFLCPRLYTKDVSAGIMQRMLLASILPLNRQ